jgi:hypothetical protein
MVSRNVADTQITGLLLAHLHNSFPVELTKYKFQDCQALAMKPGLGDTLTSIFGFHFNFTIFIFEIGSY